jgi:Flp pilus assembly protein TadD
MHAQLLEERRPDAVEQFRKAVQSQAGNQKLDAARSYVRALQLQPSFFEAAFNLAVVLQEMGQEDEAIACYRQALHLKPHYAPAWGNLGVALRDAGQNRAAIDCFHQALVCEPEAPDVLNHLGNALRAEDELVAAIACFRAALRRSPANAGIMANLGNALRDVGRVNEAVETLQHAIQLQPDYAEAHWDLAVTRLLQGDFPRGFAEYEWRWRRTDFPPRPFAAPLWCGQNLAGRTLLVHAVPGAAFYNLQVAPTAEWAGEAANRDALIGLEHLIHDFADTAALMAQLDLVISVDTSVAHLAGAVGCPVWVLLPFAPDWRWLLERGDNPWYHTMRLFRQPVPGDWTSVVQQVRTALFGALHPSSAAETGQAPNGAFRPEAPRQKNKTEAKVPPFCADTTAVGIS